MPYSEFTAMTLLQRNQNQFCLEPVCWEQFNGKSKKKMALTQEIIPEGCPTTRLFVMPGVRSAVIYWPSSGLCNPILIPRCPWSHKSLDFVTGLTPSDGNTVILTVVDRFSKMIHFIPIFSLPLAKETVEAFQDNVLHLHGFPIDVVYDLGPQFVLRFWKAFCDLIGTSVSLLSRYHPQSNGQTEQLNQELEKVLCLASQTPENWRYNLIWVEFAHNSLTSVSTGLSPFECVHGYQLPLFSALEREIRVPSAATLIHRCRCTWARACQMLLNLSCVQG